ncbi:retrovirus-related Pol polyprotein from transposon 17.6 [Trichonephila clavipes]|nr:retrovirus-related Pol polyprotein from transposon 17.6 [Trichonephila clavipes]
MAFLGKGRKKDLVYVATELGEAVSEDMKVVELKQIIVGSKNFDVEFVKNLLETVMNEREDQLERETREREFQLECLRIKQSTVIKSEGETAFNQNFQKLMPKFNLRNDDISLFLELFKRQAKVLQLPRDQWVTYLIGVLPVEINNIIAREPEEQANDYEHIREVLLKRFKLSAEKFRQLLVKTQKNSEATWYDFYHELKTFLDGWLNGLKIETFEQLRDLMLVDQIKRRAPNEFKEHFLDEWATITSPKKLVDKIEEFEDAKKRSEGS